MKPFFYNFAAIRRAVPKEAWRVPETQRHARHQRLPRATQLHGTARVRSIRSNNIAGKQLTGHCRLRREDGPVDVAVSIIEAAHDTCQCFKKHTKPDLAYRPHVPALTPWMLRTSVAPVVALATTLTVRLVCVETKF